MQFLKYAHSYHVEGQKSGTQTCVLHSLSHHLRLVGLGHCSSPICDSVSSFGKMDQQTFCEAQMKQRNLTSGAKEMHSPTHAHAEVGGREAVLR